MEDAELKENFDAAAQRIIAKINVMMEACGEPLLDSYVFAESVTSDDGVIYFHYPLADYWSQKLFSYDTGSGKTGEIALPSDCELSLLYSCIA